MAKQKYISKGIVFVFIANGLKVMDVSFRVPDLFIHIDVNSTFYAPRIFGGNNLFA